MTANSHEDLRCTVQGVQKLPQGLGGQPAVCSVIANAVLPALARAGISSSAVTVAVEVKSESRISAIAEINGRPLPEQNVAVSDRALNAGAIRMLADGLATQLSNSGK